MDQRYSLQDSSPIDYCELDSRLVLADYQESSQNDEQKRHLPRQSVDSGLNIEYEEQHVPIKASRIKRPCQGLSVTNFTGNAVNEVTKHSYLEVEADATVVDYQIPPPDLPSNEEGHVPQFSSNEFLYPEMVLQQATNEAQAGKRICQVTRNSRLDSLEFWGQNVLVFAMVVLHGI